MSRPLHRSLPLAALVCAGLLVAACGTEPLDDAEAPDLAQSEQPLTVSSGTFSATVLNWPVVSRGPTGEAQVAFSGSASRQLREAFSFVPDDAFGEATATARAFTATLRYGHEVNSILSGLPLLVRLSPQTGTTDAYFLQLQARPAARLFKGSSLLQVDALLQPVYSRDPANPLRYRVRVVAPASVTSLSVALSTGLAVAAKKSGAAWVADLDYAQLDLAFVGGLSVQAQAPSHVYKKSFAVGVKLTGLAVTKGDPYEVWPPPSCTAAVRTCVSSNPTDVGACGSYRDVARCVAESPCVLVTAPLGLTPVAAPALETARLAYNQGAKSGFTWSSASAARAFEVTGCGATLQDVVDLLAEDERSPEFLMGTVLTQVEGSSPFFSVGNSSNAPAFYSAANAFGQASAEGWHTSMPVPCHNCTEFADRVVLYYPATQRAVVIDGVHGWDS